METPHMKWTLRFLAAGTVLAAAGLIAANTGLAEEVGLDVWNVPDLQDRVAAAESRDAEMTLENWTVIRRLDWRKEVVADLIAGRITGEEAHARFLDVNRSHPKATQFLRTIWPGRTDEERTATQLVRYVRVYDHPRAAEVAAELECELMAQFADQSGD
jgi:hypothetical protein